MKIIPITSATLFLMIHLAYGQNSSAWPANGNVYIATSNPATTIPLHVGGNTEQLRLGHDTTNFASFAVNSVGQLTIKPSYIGAATGLVISTGLGTYSQVFLANFNIAHAIASGSTASTGYILPGVATMSYRIGIHGMTEASVGSNNSYASFIIGQENAVEATSGTHFLFAQQIIRPVTPITGTAEVINSASLYLEGAATANVTKNYAIWSANGLNYLGETVSVGSRLMPTGYQLAVNGSFISTNIVVKAYGNWPDYVFKKGYQSPSLAMVKVYIDKNGHLPGLPSAQEVAEIGLGLGKTSKELT